MCLSMQTEDLRLDFALQASPLLRTQFFWALPSSSITRMRSRITAGNAFSMSDTNLDLEASPTTLDNFVTQCFGLHHLNTN